MYFLLCFIKRPEKKNKVNKCKCEICNQKSIIRKKAIIWRKEYNFCSQDCWAKWANSFNLQKIEK